MNQEQFTNMISMKLSKRYLRLKKRIPREKRYLMILKQMMYSNPLRFIFHRGFVFIDTVNDSCIL